MSVSKIVAGQNYKGILVRGESYSLLENGDDYFKVSSGGRPVFVPKWVTERCLEQESREREKQEQSE